MAYSFSEFTRSRGLKLFTICVLVLLMGIPMIFVSLVSFDRQGRAQDVTQEVSKRYGGPQYVTGPYLSVPYMILSPKNEVVEEGEYVIFPENGKARFDNVKTEIRQRSLFKVPVFEAHGEIGASFTLPDKQALAEHYLLDWTQARIMIGVSDSRGLRDEVYLTDKNSPQERIKFEPAGQGGALTKSGTYYADLATQNTAYAGVYSDGYRKYGSYTKRIGGTFLSVPAKAFVGENPDADQDVDKKGFDISVSLDLGGAQTLGIYPFAKTTQAEISSAWPTPGFKGGFAPSEREITPDGFTASWTVPYLARGVLGQGKAQNMIPFSPNDNAMSVQLVSQVNPYQTVNRALKYSVLFIGLVFLVFFLFELILGKRVHPAQYILIGLAQCVFYLLLLAFAEKTGFTPAYLIAASATILITSLYAGSVFGGRQYAGQAVVVFTATYGLLYILMQKSDYALLLGAVTSFAAIALTMYITRDMNWYGDEAAEAPAGT